MGKIFQYIAGGLVPLVLACSGCDKKSESTGSAPLEILTGKPVSVDKEKDSHILHIVIEKDGKKIYGRTEPDIPTRACDKAYYLVRAEIFDGDEQPIELMGRRLEDRDSNKIFWITTVTVEGKDINLY